MNLNKFLQSKTLKIFLRIVFSLIVLLLVFNAGLMVGYRKAGFSYRWSENYHRNFGGPRNGFFDKLTGQDFIQAHGTFGQIIKIDGSTLIVKGRDGVEKIVLLSDNTVIKRFHETIKLTDLKLDDFVVIISNPNNAGQTEAKFIRLMPMPFEVLNSSTTSTIK